MASVSLLHVLVLQQQSDEVINYWQFAENFSAYKAQAHMPAEWTQVKGKKDKGDFKVIEGLIRCMS